MSVTANDLKLYLTGADSDGGVQSDADASVGKYRSSSEITSGELNNLFDDVGSAEASAGDTEYRCFCIKNEAAETLYNVKVWLYSENDPNSDQAISYAVEVPETANLTNGDAQSVGDESSAPTVNTTDHNGVGSGISDWDAGTTKETGQGVDQGAHDAHLDTGELIFIWVKRVISSSSQAQSNMSFTIRLEGDTL